LYTIIFNAQYMTVRVWFPRKPSAVLHGCESKKADNHMQQKIRSDNRRPSRICLTGREMGKWPANLKIKCI